MSFAGQELTCIRGDRLVFSDLDFSVSPGEALVVEGPNGSGKSSLLRLAAGLLRPAAGGLTWKGRPLAEDPDSHHARLHYVGHLEAVKPVFTVEENLHFWATMHGGGHGGDRGGDRGVGQDVGAALERLGIDHLADMPAGFLSAGQRRRLNLARIIAAHAPLWLLDEPTTALDVSATAMVRDLIVEHVAAGGLVMMATHIHLDLPGARTLHLAPAARIVDVEAVT